MSGNGELFLLPVYSWRQWGEFLGGIVIGILGMNFYHYFFSTPTEYIIPTLDPLDPIVKDFLENCD